MERETVTFIAYKPFLSMGYISLFSHMDVNHSLANRSVSFDEECKLTTDNVVAIQGLREYAERTKDQYIIAELIEGLDLEKFIELHNSAEESYLEKMEKEAEASKRESTLSEDEQDLREEMLKFLGR